jgi:hypothetical protein
MACYKHTIQGDNMNDDDLCLENQAMSHYEVTFVNGEVLEIEAWTPTIAQAIAEEETDLDVISVHLLRLQSTEG